MKKSNFSVHGLFYSFKFKHNLPKPPSIIPSDPILAKPHKAYVMIASVLSSTQLTSPVSGSSLGTVPLSRMSNCSLKSSYAMNSFRNILIPISSAA